MLEKAMVEELMETAVAAAQAGGAVLRRYFRREDLQVRAKEGSAHDFVTRADFESEAAVVAEIRRRYPRHQILAEEGGLQGEAATVQWVIDPLDGTTNFLRGVPMFCVSIACRQGSQLLAGAVLDPLRDELFVAGHGAGASCNGRPLQVSACPELDRAFLATGFPFRSPGAARRYVEVFGAVFAHTGGMRRLGAAALDLAYTAAGIYDGFFEFGLSPWDVAAGGLIVREAGGRVTDLDGGEDVVASGNLVAGGPAVQAQLLQVVARHTCEAELAAKPAALAGVVGCGAGAG